MVSSNSQSEAAVAEVIPSFQVGDVVRLRSDDVQMTITSALTPGRVKCVFRNPRTNALRYEEFSTALLRHDDALDRFRTETVKVYERKALEDFLNWRSSNPQPVLGVGESSGLPIGPVESNDELVDRFMRERWAILGYPPAPAEHDPRPFFLAGSEDELGPVIKRFLGYCRAQGLSLRSEGGAEYSSPWSENSLVGDFLDAEVGDEG
jgi:uncharacterized protein YodC (DUF2158 family)